MSERRRITNTTRRVGDVLPESEGRGTEADGISVEVTFIFRMRYYLLQGTLYIRYRVVIMRKGQGVRPCYG